MRRFVRWTSPAILVLSALLLAGCDGEGSTPSLEGLPAEHQTLTMAVLPVIDILPFHVADQNGFFEQIGVNVELVPVKSAQERDTLMQTGQVDGMLTDFSRLCYLTRRMHRSGGSDRTSA